MSPSDTPRQDEEAAAGFAPGTRLLTARGEVEVERLVPGDLLLALSSPHAPLRPFRTLAEAAAPGWVRLRAGALGRGAPARDLLVGPGQLLSCDGALVEARRLVNGANVLAEPAPAGARLFRPALDAPETLVAEGAPAATGRPPGVPPPPAPEALAALRVAISLRGRPAPPPDPAAAAFDALLPGAGPGAPHG